MKRQTQAVFILAFATLFAGTIQSTAQTDCVPNWTANEYKSFGDIQSEIKNQYGEVRILRVALCDEGANAYFLVVIISGQGEVRRIQLAASN